MDGDEARSARLFAMMAATPMTARSRACDRHRHPVGPGRTGHFARQGRSREQLPVDARLMLAADSLRRGKAKDAVSALEKGVTSTEVELFAPLVKAWERTARGKDDGVEAIVAMSPARPLAPIANEQKAGMLFALDKTDEALVYARKALVQSNRRAEYAASAGLCGLPSRREKARGCPVHASGRR